MSPYKRLFQGMFILALGVAGVALAPAGLTATPALAQVNQAASVTGTVSAAVLNVRAGAGTNFGRIGQLTRGQQVGLLGRNAEGTWLYVLLPNGAQGWVSARYVQTGQAIGQLAVVGAPAPVGGPDPLAGSAPGWPRDPG
ncbi:MAG: SH3 domain-containing protein [Anaerolineae bacterium]|nr:SH3 domain-containing protein [Anaerolineae bacterium]